MLQCSGSIYFLGIFLIEIVVVVVVVVESNAGKGGRF